MAYFIVQAKCFPEYKEKSLALYNNKVIKFRDINDAREFVLKQAMLEYTLKPFELGRPYYEIHEFERLPKDLKLELKHLGHITSREAGIL